MVAGTTNVLLTYVGIAIKFMTVRDASYNVIMIYSDPTHIVALSLLSHWFGRWDNMVSGGSTPPPNNHIGINFLNLTIYRIFYPFNVKKWWIPHFFATKLALCAHIMRLYSMIVFKSAVGPFPFRKFQHATNIHQSTKFEALFRLLRINYVL